MLIVETFCVFFQFVIQSSFFLSLLIFLKKKWQYVDRNVLTSALTHLPGNVMVQPNYLLGIKRNDIVSVSLELEKLGVSVNSFHRDSYLTDETIA